MVLAALLAVLCIAAPPVGAQPSTAPADSFPAAALADREFHLAPARNAAIVLAHGWIVPGSVRLSVDGAPWTEGVDFKVRTRVGTVAPLRAWRADGAEDGPPAVVVVSYRFLPAPVADRRDLRPTAAAPARDPVTGAVTLAAPADEEAWRADNLRVSGSKTVQVSRGTQRELTVDQNLRLNLSGQLTPDITVRAFLSDDNLPVVPEGNTEELRDVDKVLVELRSRTWNATLGDFVAERRGTEFGDYRRKLQGVSVEATPSSGQAELLAGSPRGRYRTLQVRGQESNQGPYDLGGAPGTNLFIVAGSERVTLDGVLLTRGADRDYVVDYVQGTVTFTYRRLITAESTIVVEFEEGEGPYGRTVVGGGGGAQGALPGLGVAASLTARIVREKDDPQRLRTGDLAEDDEAVLRTAGDDPLLAVAPGATPVAPGAGSYDQVDQGGKIIYVHAPAGGDWDIVAYWVGAGLGDYDLDRLTDTGERVYVHRGDGAGSYRLGRPLDLPASLSVMTLQTALGDTAGAHLQAEWDVSQQDRNLLSDLDDGDNKGQALSLRGALPGLGTTAGAVSAEAFYLARQAAFHGFQLHRNVFDYDDWGLAERAQRAGFLDEGEREAGAVLGLSSGARDRALELRLSGGTLRHGQGVRAARGRATARWRLAGGDGDHQFLAATASDDTDPMDTERLNQRHVLGWSLGPLRPTVRWQDEQWTDARIAGSRAAGFRLERWAAGLGSNGGSPGWRAEFERGLADSLRDGSWQRARDSRTATASVTTGRLAGMRLVGEGTLRHVLRPRGEDEKTRLARVDLVGSWASSGSDWSLGYRVDNSRAEVLDRQIVFVGQGQGDYNADGEYVGPEQGDHTVAYAGTDSLVATTAVRTDLQWRQAFRFLGADRWYGAWSLTTTGSVEGRSTTDDVGGLLRLEPGVLFDPEAAVLADVTLNEEIALLQHLSWVDLRGKFDYRETMDRQYADHPEDRLGRNWQAIGTLNVSARSSLRLRWAREQDRRLTAESGVSTRRSYIALTRRYEAGWTLRLQQDLRLGLQGEVLRRTDEVSGVAQSESAVRPTGRWRIRRAWTIQADARLADVTSDEPAGAVRPWFFPEPGRNVESSLRLAWEPSAFLTVSGTWFTRKQGEGRWQHDVRLETTARF